MIFSRTEARNTWNVHAMGWTRNHFVHAVKNINFPTEKIKSYLSFDIGRWDIILKNGIVIKLPHINYIEGTNNFISIYNKEEFSKFKVFDYRIKDQLILK